jgi:hypothetical protein
MTRIPLPTMTADDARRVLADDVSMRAYAAIRVQMRHAEHAYQAQRREAMAPVDALDVAHKTAMALWHAQLAAIRVAHHDADTTPHQEGTRYVPAS